MWPQLSDIPEFVDIAAGIGRPARQRTTTYAPLAA
jgi:hypothetical protein